MAELQLTRIKSIYGDLKGLLSQIPLAETNALVDQFIVLQINQSLDNLSNVTNTDFSTYKIPETHRSKNRPDRFPTNIVRVQLGKVITRLENEYGFGQNSQFSTNPGIVIFNKNQNEISLEINYTINDLIADEPSHDGKDRLKELKEELGKPDKNWEKIKAILIWILNYSKELSLKIIPIILQSKL